MKNITFTGWNVGFNKVGMTKLMRSQAGMSLSEAKGVTDSILAGQAVSIRIESDEVALQIYDAAVELRAIGTLDS